MPSPSPLQRLKERKLVQWALAYLAGAFVVFQLLDALETPLGLTATTQQGILVAVGIGFFIALIFAYVYGMHRLDLKYGLDDKDEVDSYDLIDGDK